MEQRLLFHSATDIIWNQNRITSYEYPTKYRTCRFGHDEEGLF